MTSGQKGRHHGPGAYSWALLVALGGDRGADVRSTRQAQGREHYCGTSIFPSFLYCRHLVTDTPPRQVPSITHTCTPVFPSYHCLAAAARVLVLRLRLRCRAGRMEKKYRRHSLAFSSVASPTTRRAPSFTRHGLQTTTG